MKQTKIRRSPLSYERKKQYYAYGFIALWLVGVIFYFFRPLVQMVAYSLSDIVLTDTGYHLDFVGLKEFDRALRTDNKFIQNLAGSLGAMLYQVPVVVFFSLAVAVLLNKPFLGRTVARAVFFIPVIVTSGVVLSVLNGSGTSGENTLLQAQSSNMFSIRGSSDVLYELGLPQQIVTLLVDTANNIFNLSWKSGVQILIFLAALQTISPSLFEAARVEGANAWDTFWKLTIPSISPMILLCLVYSVIDSFVDYDNVLMNYIQSYMKQLDIEYSSTMVFMYSLVIFAIVGLVFLCTRRLVFYADDRDN